MSGAPGGRRRRPRRFERNLVVIGGGAAGLVSAYVAARARARVTLIEAGRMGGDCLYTGCVPSKALIRTARFLHEARHADALGIRSAEVEWSFAEVMARVQRVIRRIEPHDSAARYGALGVEVLAGRARLLSPWEVAVEGRTLTTRAIVIATGARPAIPPIPGLEAVGCLTSETLWGLESLPRRLLVLGGGPIGCELAQAFARLGSGVTLVEQAGRLMGREDPEVSALVAQALGADGVEVLTGHRALRAEIRGGGPVLWVAGGAGERPLGCDRILCALGRVPHTEGLGLEALGIPLTAGGAIQTDAWLRTLHPHVYAAGDVAGPYQFTHTAAHQAWYAAVNALFSPWWRRRVDDSVIPWATFTDPEVARVGLSESEAVAAGIPHEVTRYDLGELDRAITEEAPRGLVKVLTVPGRDRILGVVIVGEQAGELLAEFVLAMRHGLGLRKILATLHVYPTLAEANKRVAGVWQGAHVPGWLPGLLERYHAWRRG